MSDPLLIDWHEIKERVSEQVVRGGVIHVIPGSKAPVGIFVRTLIDVWIPEVLGPNHVKVISDPDDAETREPSDLVRKIAHVAGVALPDRSAQEPLVNIATDVEANSVSVHDVKIKIGAAWRANDDIEYLRNGLGASLADRPLILVFQRGHRMLDLHRQRLAREVWVPCLSKFRFSGLVTVWIGKNKKARSHDDYGFPPPPDLVVDLPTYWAGEDGKGQVLDDVADHAVRNGWFRTEEEARSFAAALVLTENTMGGLHTKVGVYGAKQRGLR